MHRRRIRRIMDANGIQPNGGIVELLAALRRDDLAGADEILSNGRPRIPDAALGSAAQAMMRQRRWRDAAWLYAHLSSADLIAQFTGRFCTNLDALQRHRPALYQMLISLPASDRYRIGVATTGLPTIIYRSDAGRDLHLSPQSDPLGNVRRAMKSLESEMSRGTSLGLCGLADGYLLAALAAHPPKLFMDMRQTIHVIEPDAQVLLQCLMIHDYTGPAGPIEQDRFLWFVGPSALDDLRATLLNDLFLPCPAVHIGQGLNTGAITSALTQITQELCEADQNRTQAVAKYYRELDPAERKAVFGANPPRAPRVLLMTTRFSTVLQYSTSDTAAGFREAGWDARIAIEPTTHHRLFGMGIRRTLLEWKPDLVFQIDHQRHEHNGLFPDGLPFACWIQDHLSQLMSREAGAKVGPMDFVLTDAGSTYVKRFDYPARQVIATAKLTTPPPLLPRPGDCSEDLVFVSNASHTPDALLKTRLDGFNGSALDRDFMAQCVHNAEALYARGESLPTYVDVCAFLREQLASIARGMPDEEFHDFARWLNHPVCDALYRQQTLRWATTTARELGLSLSLYGKGWAEHPEFAPHARGVVAPGAALHELTRRAAINLQIAPYFCLHQRLLDGICSGAFFLVRQHISDTAPQAMADLLQQHGLFNAGNLPEARQAMPNSARPLFEKLVQDCERCLCSTGAEDPIEMIRAWEEAQLICVGNGVLPRLGDISFSNAAELRERLSRFAKDPDLRERITAVQRQDIANRLTYRSNMMRVARRIGELLPASSSQAASSSHEIPEPRGVAA